MKANKGIRAYFTLIALLLICSLRAADWQATPGLSATANSFGGAFARTAAFNYAADRQLGGRLRKLDPISASGTVRIQPRAGFNAAVQLGHFEKDGGSLSLTDFVGIRFMELSAGALRAQAFVLFDRGIIRQGPMISLPTGEYTWSYEWTPNAGNHGHGHLRVQVGAQASELHLSAETANLFFACNAFGLHAGYQAIENPGTAEIVASVSAYTTIPRPEPGPRTRVFLLIGQSNARGDDPNVFGLGELTEPQPSVIIWDGAEWVRGQAPSEPANKFGCEFSLGRELARILQEPVAILKVTKGGSGLEPEWLPGAPMFERIVSTTREALAKLDRPILSGIFSIHGESDSGRSETASRYGANLAAVHTALQAELRVKAPIIVTRLPAWIFTSWKEPVRAAQETFPWVNTDDLTNMGDSLHFNAITLNEIGQRLAAKYFEISAPIFLAWPGELGVAAAPGAVLLIESSDDLERWIPTPQVALRAFTSLAGEGKRFYRLATPSQP